MEKEKQKNRGGEINDSPIEQVRLTVPITDDPTLPVLTFRTWVLGPLICAIYASLGEIFSYRRNAINLSSSCLTIMLLFVGKLMVKTLPSRPIKIPILNWSFSMNPGSFNIKEHVVLSILVGSGGNEPFGITILSLSKLFYHKNLKFWAMMQVVLTSQFLGYGLAGIFMNFLVNSPHMWFPLCLTDVSYYRALNEESESESPIQKKKTRQFFIISIVTSFAFAIIPGYFFPSLGAISLGCLIWNKSVLAQIIGSGMNGFGIGSFSLDWNAISSYLGNPLAYPYPTIVNMMIGFVLFLYVLTPIAYCTNLFNAKQFALYSSDFYDNTGQLYNVSRIVINGTTLNQKEYQNYSKVYFGIVFALLFGISFANTASTVTYFLLYHSRDAYRYFKDAYFNNNEQGDVHNRLMKKYKPVPQWWFLVILVLSVVLAILSCEVFDKQLQLPYWGILLSCLMAIVFLLPVGVLTATTGQSLTLNTISELLWGYISPSQVFAAWVFRTYSLTTMSYAITFLGELKLAHYMKIPPRSIFVAQVVGTFITSSVRFLTAWWIFTHIENICHPDLLPRGSPWTCPTENYFYGASIVWGLIGPAEVFYPHGIYSNLYYCFLIGVIATLLVWCLSRMFPEQKWIELVNIPNILSGISMVLIAGAANYWSWFTVGSIFNFYVYRNYKKWWAKYNYTLANGLDLGLAILVLLTSLTLQFNGIYGVNWWGEDVGDHCPLATCPTAPGIKLDGCPVFD